MPRRRDKYEEDDHDDAVDEDDEDHGSRRGSSRSRHKRRRSDFIDDVAEEEEEEYDEDDEDYGSGGGGGGSRRRGGKAAKKAPGAGFFELEADVDTDGEEEEEENGEDDFIDNERVDLRDEEDSRRTHQRPLLPREDDQEDVEDLARRIRERFARNHAEYDDADPSEVEQQALLPSIHDPKFWMVKCVIGHEREVAVCLMQKCIDIGSELQIRSAIALDYLKNYIYVEADKEAHVKEACRGMRNIYTGSKIMLVPIKEMTDVLSVESKAVDLTRDTWVRMKIRTYKKDLAKAKSYSKINPEDRLASLGKQIVGGKHVGGGRRKESLVGSRIKIRRGPFHGYNGLVVGVNVKTNSIQVELEANPKVVTVDRTHITNNVNITAPHRDTHKYGSGSETPMHRSRTPLHPCLTPMRDPGATPIHTGMRTPMHDRAWNPYTPMSPPRDSWEDGNPGSWGTSPQYELRSPHSRAYEASTSGSEWANTPGGSYANAPSPYLSSTPSGQPPMTPTSPFSPGTPGSQPMTPGSGGDNDEPWFLPDILVNVRKSGDAAAFGVIREVHWDGVCLIALGARGDGEMITTNYNEIEVVVPRKSDKIKIMGGAQRGATGKLIGVDGTVGIVKVDQTLDVQILDMTILAKLPHS